jgi:hypothetical protein
VILSLNIITIIIVLGVTDNEQKNLSSFTGRNDFFKEFSSQSLTLELVDFFQKAPIALHWLSSTGLILWANGKIK